jgi:hypothetical protein
LAAKKTRLGSQERHAWQPRHIHTQAYPSVTSDNETLGFYYKLRLEKNSCIPAFDVTKFIRSRNNVTMASNQNYLLQFLQANCPVFVNINGVELVTKIRKLFFI